MHRKQYRWPRATNAVNVEVVCQCVNGRRSGRAISCKQLVGGQG